MIKVTLEAGEEDKGNNLVDSDNGSISGAESDVNASKCIFVEIQLHADLTLLAVTTHCSNRRNWSVRFQGG